MGKAKGLLQAVGLLCGSLLADLWSFVIFSLDLDCNLAHRIKRKRGTSFAFLLLPKHPTKSLWGSAP